MGYYDPVRALAAGKKAILAFTHVPTKSYVDFPALVKSFSDSFKSNWKSEPVYGRMDPIAIFQNTERTISITWDVIAASNEEARHNTYRVDKLIQMLYPTYEEIGQANSISASPLIRFNYMNLIQAPTPSAIQSTGELLDTVVESFTSSGTNTILNTTGLLGYFDGFDYTPDYETPFADGIPEPGNVIYPMRVEMKATFHVLHEVPPGWNSKNNVFSIRNFPHGPNGAGSKDYKDAGPPPVPVFSSFGTQAKNSDGRTPGPEGSNKAKFDKVLGNIGGKIGR
jgi:hypothetical protein